MGSRTAMTGHGDRTDSSLLRRHPALEPLEPRVMLNGNTLAPVDASPVGASQVDPAWFATLRTPGQQTDTAGGSDAMVTGVAESCRSDRWIVQFTNEAVATVSSVAETVSLLPADAQDFDVIGGLGMVGLVLVQTYGSPADIVGEWFAANPNIAYFEPDVTFTLETVPDDSKFEELWGLNNTGQTGGTVDADIDAPEAWETITGGSDVVVAVLDTGVDYTHPDLAANMWVNPGEIADDGLDNDENGLIDDVHGWDFRDKNEDPKDENYHGTHVAGTIAAVGNNGQGVVGVAWNTKIMALRWISASGEYGKASDAALAVNYATMMRRDYGVNVVATNNSYRSKEDHYVQALHQAIEASRDEGILFVTSAGNGGIDEIGDNNDKAFHYPSNYDLDNIIAVASTDHNDERVSSSNYGLTTVHLGAPGEEILSTTPTVKTPAMNSRGIATDYASISGTSMACPHVTGAVALLAAKVPSAWYTQIRQAIFDGVDPVASLSGITVTGGRLNLLGALEEMKFTVTGSGPGDGAVVDAPPVDFTVDFPNALDPASVEPADLTVNTLPADSFVLDGDADSITFHFDTSPVTLQGPQAMDIAEGAVWRADDADPNAPWQAVFFYDPLPLTVTATSPAEGQVLADAPTQIVIDFSEPIQPGSIDVGDLELSEGEVTTAAPVDADTAAYTVAGLPREGDVAYVLLHGAVLDAGGIPGLSHAGLFTLDDPYIDTYTPTDVPKDRSDEGTITSRLTIVDPLLIGDVDVVLDITNTSVRDLVATLIAPDGTEIPLFSYIGGSGNDFAGTILDDEGDVPVSSGTAPFIGRYRPKGLLSVVDASDAQGEWKLKVIDDSERGGAWSLNSWSLVIEVDVVIPPIIKSVQQLPASGQTWGSVDALDIQFSEGMAAATVNNLANWELVGVGADGQFDTGDDVAYSLSVLAPYVDGMTTTFQIDAGVLPTGDYRFKARSGGLTDLLGNPLDGNADGTGGDDYVRHFSVFLLPFTEDFEAGSIEGLVGDWEFQTTGSGEVSVTDANDPRDAYQLQMTQSDSGSNIVRAILHLDLLAGTTPASGVSLDFWEKTTGHPFDQRNHLYMRPDSSASWSVIQLDLHKTADYTHYAVDLDREIAEVKLNYTDDFQICFFHYGKHADNTLYLDDVRVVENGDDMFGARVLSHTPTELASDAGPLGQITVTFDEAIAPASFTPEDVVLKAPSGLAITPVAVAPVAGSADAQFTLSFADQDMRGQYRLTLGPNILDPAGNPMDQDENWVSGESSDAYAGTVEFAPTQIAIPVNEGFEIWPPASTSWSFSTHDTGTALVVTTDGPHGGTQHLKFVSDIRDADQTATVLLDLSGHEGQTDLWLDFWAKRDVIYTAFSRQTYVEVSADGQAWHQVYSTDPPSSYTHYVLDLDEGIANAGIDLAVDSRVYVRFRHHNIRGSSGDVLYLDDIQMVLGGDHEGPRVTGHTPTDLALGAGPLNEITVTFNEAIDVSSFTSDDLVLKDPQGVEITPVAVAPVGGSGDTQFTLSFADRNVRGQYRLTVGPDVQDPAGNHMDQDQDAVIGEPADVYMGTVEFAPATTTIPLHEDFETWPMAPNHWRFETADEGTVLATTDDSPAEGLQHLKLRSPKNDGLNQTATMLLDLAGYEGQTELWLGFWAKRIYLYQHYTQTHVELSTDRAQWHSIYSGDPTAIYAYYALDLDEGIANAGIDLVADSEVYVRFRHSNTNTHFVGVESLYLDDVRVTTIAPVVDLNGPDEPGTGFLASFVPGGGTVSVVDDDLSVVDSDDPQLAGATVTLTNHPDGEDELLDIDTADTSIVAATYDPLTGVLSLTGSDALANYEKVLRTLTYDNTAAGPEPVTRVIEVIVNDGTHDSNTAIARVDLAPPTITAWHSAGVHDGAERLLEIPDDGGFSEPRTGGIQTLVVDFSEEVDLAGASVAFAGNDGNGAVDLSGITATVSGRDGDTAQIAFSEPLPDDVRYAVRLDGVRDEAGHPLAGDNDRIVTALAGDANGDLVNNVFDLAEVWEYRGQLPGAGPAQTRADVNTDGVISALDVEAAWGCRGRDATGYAAPVLAAAPAGAATAAADDAPVPPPDDRPDAAAMLLAMSARARARQARLAEDLSSALAALPPAAEPLDPAVLPR